MAEERQASENKYEADAKEHSQETTELKFKLRAERIERAELRAENQAVWNAIRALEQSLEEHKDYIKQTIEQIYKAICKAREMFDKAEALHQSFVPIGRNGQQLLNFIEEVKDHYEQVKAFYGYNCNMLNNV